MNKQKFSAVFSISLIRSAHNTLIGLSKTFKDKRQRQNFITFVLSLVIQGTPNLSRINEIDNSKIDWSRRLSHFLKQTLVPNQVQNIYQSFITKHLRGLKFVALDWTALVKTGKCFEHECDVYDSRDEKIHDGFPLLLATGFSKDKKLWLPLLWKLASWSKPDFISENKIICSFIRELAKFLQKLKKKPIFLMDRGFARKPIIIALLENNLSFIIQAYENRLIILADGVRTKLQNLKPGFYKDVTIIAWKISINIVVYGNGDNRKILLTNLSADNYALSDIQEYFSVRGKIEPNIKETKQGFGLEKFMVRNFQAINNSVGLILLAYSITQVVFTKFRRTLLWARRKILHLKTKIKRLTAQVLRRLIRRIIFFGLSNKYWLRLAKNRANPL